MLTDDPNETELLDEVDLALAKTAAPKSPSRWCREAAEAGVEFATALLKFPIDVRPDRPVSLPGYPVDEVYHRGFQRASDLVEAWDDCADDTDFDASEADWLALDWSHRLCKHLIARFGWAPWMAFEAYSLGEYLGDEACHEHHRQLAAGPYALTAFEVLALRIVRKRPRRLLLTAGEEGDTADAAEFSEAVEARAAFHGEPAEDAPRPPALFVLIPPVPLPSRADGKLMMHKADAVNVMFKPVLAADVPPDAIVLPGSTPERPIRFDDWVKAGGRTR